MTAHNAPSNGTLRTAWIRPPVTTLAVPIVSSTKPQKMPACIRPARGSLNILVWTKAYSTSPPSRSSGRSTGAAGWSAARTRRLRAKARHKAGEGPLDARGRLAVGPDAKMACHRQDEDEQRPVEEREDERVARDLGECRKHALEHQAAFDRPGRLPAAVVTDDGSPLGRSSRPAARAAA